MKVLVCVLALFASALAAPQSHSLGYVNGRIVGGWDAERGEFPFIVSLQWCILSFCQHSCGGSIISKNWVATAAHCSTEAPGIGSYRVLAGVLNLDDDNPERQLINVAQHVVHPEYAGGVAPNDIALFRLASNLVYNQYVQPISLPQQYEEVSGLTVLIGWGSTGGVILPQMPNELQKVDIPVVPIQECDEALNEVLSGAEHPLDYEVNVCTGPLTGGVSACSGDSGGPLVNANADELVGIVSWGITPCGTTGAPSVYVKVSSYVAWIKSITGDV